MAIQSTELSLIGFITLDLPQNSPEIVKEFKANVSEFLRKVEITFEDIIEGIENSPYAVTGILYGKYFGKTVMKLFRDYGISLGDSWGTHQPFLFSTI
ncbi:hypothetical protein V1524DRAFT_461186 [Lipomyces starkeyi]